jgi:hypothetical protein
MVDLNLNVECPKCYGTKYYEGELCFYCFGEGYFKLTLTRE